MLVLSRKVNEVLVINYGGIQFRVCVTEIKGDKVKIGVEAPLEVQVDRLEVWEAKQRNNTLASSKQTESQGV